MHLYGQTAFQPPLNSFSTSQISFLNLSAFQAHQISFSHFPPLKSGFHLALQAQATLKSDLLFHFSVFPLFSFWAFPIFSFTAFLLFRFSAFQLFGVSGFQLLVFSTFLFFCFSAFPLFRFSAFLLFRFSASRLFRFLPFSFSDFQLLSHPKRLWHAALGLTAISVSQISYLSYGPLFTLLY